MDGKSEKLVILEDNSLSKSGFLPHYCQLEPRRGRVGTVRNDVGTIVSCYAV